MALAKLSIVYSNLGRPSESADFARRALQHADRLSTRERLYIEGVYYGRRPETTDQSIAAYRKLIDLYPDHLSGRHNLGLAAYLAGDVNGAIEHLEEVARRGTEFPSTYGMLAGSYARRGDFTRADALLRDYLQRYPASGAGYANVGNLRLVQGRFDDGAQAYDKALALGARPALVLPQVWALASARERWNDATAASAGLVASGDVFGHAIGTILQAKELLFRGQTAEALRHLNAAAPKLSRPGNGFAWLEMARIEFARGNLARALALAETAHSHLAGIPEQCDAVVLRARVHTQQGRSTAAQEALDELRKAVNVVRRPRASQCLHLLEAAMARARGDVKAARTALVSTDAALLPWIAEAPTLHAEIWEALGEADLAAGDRASAAQWFQRIVDRKVDVAYSAFEVVRSHYHLGRIAEQNGDPAGAKRHYQRFVDFWKNGDIDRPRIAEAAARLR